MSAPIPPEQQPQQPQQPVQTAMLPPKMPWTPFAPMPTDDEPVIAALRKRRLGKLIDSAKFEGMAKEWQQTAIQEYQRMREVESQAAMAVQQAQSPKQQPPAGKPLAEGAEP